MTDSLRPVVPERLRAVVRRAIDDRVQHGLSTDVPYECLGCETPYALQYHVCPACGSYSVELRRDVRETLVAD